MWDKYFRQAIFTAVYQLQFYAEQSWPWQVDWQYIIETISKEQEDIILDTKHLSSVLAIFEEQEQDFVLILKKHMPNWEKTFPLVKACLFTFLLEYREVTELNLTEASNNIIGKYLRLSEEIIGGQNVALVHAVLSKIVKEQE